MPLRDTQIERYEYTIWAIANSEYVKRFLIGYTSRAGIYRYNEYKRLGYEHLVILADRLTEIDAKNLEQKLQDKCWNDHRRALYQKYNRKRRDKPYRPGTPSRSPHKKLHTVYMAWWEP
jgi:hypothetical protein